MGHRGSDPGSGGINPIISILIISQLVLVGILGFFTFESEVVRGGSTIYVGSGAGNDSATISGGISLANNGDTVYVYNGIYNEHVVVNKNISLTGENRDTVTIDGQGSSDVVRVETDWVNITGFTVTGSGSNPGGFELRYSGSNGN